MIPAEVDSFSWLRVILAFAVVTGLLGLLNYALRRFAVRGMSLPKRGQTRRLGVVETLQLDNRRRLVIARCDGREHLLLLGPDRDLVVASDLTAPEISSNPVTL